MVIAHTITGIVALICYFLLVIKYPLRKLGLHDLNASLMKLHEAMSGLFFLAMIAHLVLGLIFGLPAMIANRVLLAVCGFAALIISFILTAACHMTKDVKKKMYWHRWYSLILTVAIVIHVVCAWV